MAPGVSHAGRIPCSSELPDVDSHGFRDRRRGPERQRRHRQHHAQAGEQLQRGRSLSADLARERHGDGDGREHGKTKIPDARLKVINDIIPSEIFLKDVILGEYFLVLSLIKREIIDDIRFNTSRVFLEDAEFYLTMLLKKLRCAYLPVVFYAYRKHAEAVTVRVHPQKLHDAFSFSSLCYNLAKKTDNGILKELLIIEGVKNYKFDLKAVAESKRSIEEIRTLYKECKLSVIRKETIDSLKCLNNTYNQFICVIPVMLLIRYYRIIFCIKKQWHTIKSN